jgi:cell division protein FtsL
MQNKYIILKSPVKIGDYERVASYSEGLTKGEEQLLVTRDLKFFLTDGKGGYLEFKSINSGITLDEVNQKLKDLDNKISDEISDLDDKSSKDIKTLKDAVDALSLKFSGYVTTEDFEDLKTKIESNTTLATHDNREVLDKFSVDKDDNPLFNGKKIVADFDTSGIEAEIANLNARSIIGSNLDYGLFGISKATSIGAGDIVPFNTTYMNNGLTVSNGVVKLKKGRKYEVKAQSATNVSNNNVWFFIQANSVKVGKSGWCGNVNQISIPAVAIIDCSVDTSLIITTSNEYNIDDSCALLTYLEIVEIGRITVIDPCEDGKNINFEYGYFKANQSSNLASGNHLELDMIKGNMTVSNGSNQEKGLITLHGNKKYKLDFSYSNAGNSTNGIIDFNVCDSNGNILEDLPYAYPTTYTGDSQASPVSTFILEPTIDTVINFKIAANASHWVGAYLVIEEIAQPYYFNYYKDSSQTTTLFTGAADTKSIDYTLSDSIQNYEKIIVYAACNINGVIREKTTNIINVSEIENNNKYEFIVGFSINASYYYFIEFAFPSDRTFNIANNGFVGWLNPIIYKIEGIGYTYENPYQDVITTIDEFTVADSTIDSDINSVWNEVGI